MRDVIRYSRDPMDTNKLYGKSMGAGGLFMDELLATETVAVVEDDDRPVAFSHFLRLMLVDSILEARVFCETNTDALLLGMEVMAHRNSVCMEGQRLWVARGPTCAANERVVGLLDENGVVKGWLAGD